MNIRMKWQQCLLRSFVTVLFTLGVIAWFQVGVADARGFHGGGHGGFHGGARGGFQGSSGMAGSAITASMGRLATMATHFTHTRPMVTHTTAPLPTLTRPTAHAMPLIRTAVA